MSPMTNGLGTGFFAVSLLAVLAGVAALLVLTTGGAFLARRRTGEVPQRLRYLAVGLLAVVVAVAGFGVLALVDKSVGLAGFLLLTVFGPLALVGVRVYRDTDIDAEAHAGPLDVLAATGMAWGPPFVAGICVLFAVVVGVGSVLNIVPGATARTVLSWVGALAAGAVVVVGDLLLVDSVMRLLRLGR